jgi:hypothetical protein
MATIRQLAIANLQSDIEYYRGMLEKFADNIIKYTDAPDAFLDLELPAESSVSGYLYPSVTIPFDHARNDAIIGELYTVIGKAPYKSTETLESIKNWELGTEAYWTFGPDSTFSRLQIRFNPGEGATCKRVQVGTRTVEEPLYKIECTNA